MFRWIERVITNLLLARVKKQYRNKRIAFIADYIVRNEEFIETLWFEAMNYKDTNERHRLSILLSGYLNSLLARG